jgi:hypothetical protein
MLMNFEQEYLSGIVKQFQYYKLLGDKTFNQLDEKALFHQINSESNSIAIIVNHLNGNMLSRWTNFLLEDGEKEWRERDEEFKDVIRSKDELVQKWEEGWICLFDALASVNNENYTQTVYIRNMGHSIIEAINRQLAHYAYHVGQIVFIGKALKGNEWESLSIARGASETYNKLKFSQEKGKRHFTDDYLGEKE